MKTPSLNLIRQELGNLSQKQLLDTCLRLAKYKKENKELLGYLLFDAIDEAAYIKAVKAEIEMHFDDINRSNMFFVRKSLRKIVRTTNKYIKYSGQKTTEVELLIFFCAKLKDSKIDFRSVNSLNNLYFNQLKKIRKTVSTLHEDLQFDYQQDVEKLLD